MASTRRDASVMGHPVVITFLIMAVVATMSLAADVLKPLALSVLLSFALAPLAGFLESRVRLPRALAVVMTVLLALGALGFVGYVVGEQLKGLANRLPAYQSNIEKKIQIFKPGKEWAIWKAASMAQNVARKLDAADSGSSDSNILDTAKESDQTKSSPTATPVEVRVVPHPSFGERIQSLVGPYLEFLGLASFVLVLVLFMLMNREDLRDRIVRIFGDSRVSVTTRTLNEIGQRISRYLATFAAVNSAFGLVVGLGLWAIGVEYALLWGCMAAMLRFIPYVGPAVAFGLPMLFAIAFFPGWTQPLLVFALFAVIEVALNSFLEPVIYGKTTGVSALGLLVAAMFWTWLWGLLGILLSTPLTVCLAVLGKYVPSLGIFATLLGEEVDFAPNVRFYQRLVALDRDGAVDVVEEAFKTSPRVAVFDTLLIPALFLAGRDAAAGALGDQDLAFVWRVIGEVIDDLEGQTEITLASVAAANAVGDFDPNTPSLPAPRVLGVAASDTGDALVLKMLSQLLSSSGLTLELVTEAESPRVLAERVAELRPAMVVLSHLPPEGFTSTRYQLRRLHARFADLPILVGRWGASTASATADEQLAGLGASHVSSSLADACEHITSALSLARQPEPIGELAKVGT